jgi:hypothetical protein
MKNASDRGLMRACARYILGESTGVKIKGSPERRDAIHRVLTASKALYEALSSNRSLDEVNVLIERKRAAAQEFKKIVGITWQL